MKKAAMIFITVLFSLFLYIPANAAHITVEIDGETQDFGAEPVNIDGRVLVPMRGVFEALGADVEWNGGDYSVTAAKDGKAIRLFIDSPEIKCGIVNSDNVPVFSSAKQLDTYARLIDDLTYVPVRAVTEALNYTVGWDGENQRVTVSTDAAKGAYTFFYSSSDDYGKLYRVDSNGVNREKLSDKSFREVRCNNGCLYLIDYDGRLFKCADNGGGMTQLTDFDTIMIGFYGDTAYFIRNEGYNKGELFRYDGELTAMGNVQNPEIHGKYLYYNRFNENVMFILNLENGEITNADMEGDYPLSPFNCMFYSEYILVQDDSLYHNIYRFNADGSGRKYINSANSRICENQQPDDTVLFVNNDDGQSIYSVGIDGGGISKVAGLPDGTVYADVLAQCGDIVYYKNMYRNEIYRVYLSTCETYFTAYGDSVKVFDNKLFTDNDGLYISETDGSGSRKICGRKLRDYYAVNGEVFGTDTEYGNIVKTDYGGNEKYLTNDRVISYDTDIPYDTDR